MSHATHLVVLALLVGCGPTEEPPAEPRDMAGAYNLAFTQENSGCLPGVASYEDIFGFLDSVDLGTPVGSAVVTQDGGVIEASLSPASCLLEGSVDSTGTFDLGGSCSDATLGRELFMTGTVTPEGSNLRLAGTMAIEVDVDDGAGGGPDGVAECTVDRVAVTGLGVPPTS